MEDRRILQCVLWQTIQSFYFVLYPYGIGMYLFLTILPLIGYVNELFWPSLSSDFINPFPIAYQIRYTFLGSNCVTENTELWNSHTNSKVTETSYDWGRWERETGKSMKRERETERARACESEHAHYSWSYIFIRYFTFKKKKVFQ